MEDFSQEITNDNKAIDIVTPNKGSEVKNKKTKKDNKSDMKQQ